MSFPCSAVPTLIAPSNEELLFGCQVKEILNDIANAVLQYTSEGMDDLEKALTEEIGRQHRVGVAHGVDNYYESLLTTLQKLLEVYEETAYREVFNLPRNITADDIKAGIKNIQGLPENQSARGPAEEQCEQQDPSQPGGIISFKQLSDARQQQQNQQAQNAMKIPGANSPKVETRPPLGSSSADLDSEIETLRASIQSTLSETSQMYLQARRIQRASLRLQATIDGSVFQGSSPSTGKEPGTSQMASATTESNHEAAQMARATQQLFTSPAHASLVPVVAERAAQFAQVSRQLERLTTTHPLLRRLSPQATQAVHAALRRAAVAAQQQAGLASQAPHLGLVGIPVEAINAAANAGPPGSRLREGAAGIVEGASADSPAAAAVGGTNEFPINATTEELEALLRALTVVPPADHQQAPPRAGVVPGLSTPSAHAEGNGTATPGIHFGMLLPARVRDASRQPAQAQQTNVVQGNAVAPTSAAAPSEQIQQSAQTHNSQAQAQAQPNRGSLLDRLRQQQHLLQAQYPAPAAGTSVSTTHPAAGTNQAAQPSFPSSSLITPFRSNRVPRRDFDK